MAKQKYKQSLGEYLRSARLAAGLSQGDLGKLMGYRTNQFVSNIERDLCCPVYKTLHKLASILKLDYDELIDRILEVKHERLERDWRG